MSSPEETVSFDCSREEFELAVLTALRAVALARRFNATYKFETALMDLVATHCNGCPLDLQRLFETADDGEFGHDVFGIRAHLDRETGRLTGCFMPRFALRYQRPGDSA